MRLRNWETDPLLLATGEGRKIAAGWRGKTTITMPKERQQVFGSSQDQPVRIADPETNEEDIVLSADVYHQTFR